MRDSKESLSAHHKSLTESEAADGFAALGNRTRLRLLRLFVRAGAEGLNVGEAGQLLEVPASTLAHHLAALVRVGLVIQERRGREVVCTAHYAAIKGAAAYLTEACCAGFEGLALDSKAGTGQARVGR